MIRRGRLLLVAAAGAALLSAVTALADADPWPVARASLSYPLYRPRYRLGYKVSSFGFQRCPGGRSKASLYATYGSYRGVRSGRLTGFGLLEGSPAICSDPAGWTPHGTVWVGRSRPNWASTAIPRSDARSRRDGKTVSSSSGRAAGRASRWIPRTSRSRGCSGWPGA